MLDIVPKTTGFYTLSQRLGRLSTHRLESHGWSTMALEVSTLRPETRAVVLCTGADCQMSARAVIADRAPRRENAVAPGGRRGSKILVGSPDGYLQMLRRGAGIGYSARCVCGGRRVLFYCQCQSSMFLVS